MTDTTNIGLDVEPPEDTCSDDNCPFHGSLTVRGQVFKGDVTTASADKTATVSWGHYNKIPKYERYERRRTNVTVHNPPCINAAEGDTVAIVECQPLSKTKSYVIVNTMDTEADQA